MTLHSIFVTLVIFRMNQFFLLSFFLMHFIKTYKKLDVSNLGMNFFENQLDKKWKRLGP